MFTRLTPLSNLLRRNFATKFQKFNYEDALAFKTLLSEEEIMIMEQAKSFSQTNLMPRITNAYKNEHFDQEIMKEFGNMGFLGATINEYGLPGINHVAYGLINREIERVDSGYRSAFSVQSGLVMFPIYTFGSKEQKDKYIPDLAKGTKIGCFGLTEPNHGSDPSSMESRAVKKVYNMSKK